MRDQAIALTLSLVAPPLRSITIGRDDHLPRAWTGFEERNPSHATYTFSRASRPYTADEELDGGDLIPGFRCRVADLMPDE
jgi:hypothetical protein